MKNTLKGYLIGVLSTVMLFGCVAYAASNTKTIEALYNNIKIYVDGVKIDPKDANGNTVEPFIYNGTTYLPVRAVGEAIGKTVTWDGATQSVYLGEKPGDVQYLMEVCPPYQTDKYKEFKNGTSFSMAGKNFTNGFTLSGWAHSGDAFALFDLNGKYKTVKMNMGHVDDTDMNERTIVFYVDNQEVERYKIDGNYYPKQIEINVNYGLQLKIVVLGQYNPWPKIGFGNITVE